MLGININYPKKPMQKAKAGCEQSSMPVLCVPLMQNDLFVYGK
jgi:hypothetical protein